MTEKTKEIEKRLFELKDEEYRLFQAKLMPGIELDRIIGVRTPLLRKYASELKKDSDIDMFLSDIPHGYYDENNLHGFIISAEKNYEKAVEEVERILPYVDNWATCDLMSPKVFGKHKPELKKQIEKWLKSDLVYTRRFGLEMIMSHFLGDDFDAELIEKASKVKNDEYYAKMMVAWLFATALAKNWEETLPYIENGVLEKQAHNKTIQKAVESYRITDEQKAYLRSLKRT